jgi:hypothetical protein
MALGVAASPLFAHAGGTMIEVGTPLQLASNQVAVPVAILHHTDGAREIMPLEQADSATAEVNDESTAIQYPFPLGVLGDASFVPGIQVGSLEGLSVTLGIFIGNQGDTLLGKIRAGILLEVSPGTEATKVGLGYTVGSSPFLGFNLNATYMKSYGTITPVPVGEDLLGLELGGELTLIHWFVGVMDSIQSGKLYVNAGAGVRFY